MAAQPIRAGGHGVPPNKQTNPTQLLAREVQSWRQTWNRRRFFCFLDRIQHIVIDLDRAIALHTLLNSRNIIFENLTLSLTQHSLPNFVTFLGKLSHVSVFTLCDSE